MASPSEISRNRTTDVQNYVWDPIQSAWVPEQQPDVSGVAITVDQGSAGLDPWLVANDGSFAKETGGNLDTIVTNTSGIATAAKQDTGNTTLAEIAIDTDSLTVAQGAASSSVTGPLVQSLVSYLVPSPADATVMPLSLNQGARLRTLSSSEESETAFSCEFPDPWNIHVSPAGFDVSNRLTIDNVWE